MGNITGIEFKWSFRYHHTNSKYITWLYISFGKYKTEWIPTYHHHDQSPPPSLLVAIFRKEKRENVIGSEFEHTQQRNNVITQSKSKSVSIFVRLFHRSMRGIWSNFFLIYSTNLLKMFLILKVTWPLFVLLQFFIRNFPFQSWEEHLFIY